MARLVLRLDVGVVATARLPVSVEIVPAAIAEGSETVGIGVGGAAAQPLARVLIDGVDMIDQVVGEITVEAEEGAARVADLTLCPPAGTEIALATWTGRSVEIFVGEGSTGALRAPLVLFRGVVDLPSVDLAARTLALRCTDGLQQRVAGLSRAQIDALVGGRWSPAVFDAAAQGWAYAQNRLSTVAASLELSADGVLRLTPWAAKPTADVTIGVGGWDADLDGSVGVSLAERSELVNVVEIAFDYRFPRLKSRTYPLVYQYVDLTGFSAFFNAGNWFLQREAVLRAVQSAGGAVVGDPTWDAMPTSIMAPAPGGAFWYPNPTVDGTLCRGFTLDVAFDHGQAQREAHKITVRNDLSVAAVGLRRASLSGALEGVYPDLAAAETALHLYRADQSAAQPTDVPAVVSGLMVDTDLTLTPETNRAAANAAMECLIDVAKVMIAAAHRRHEVTVTVPIMPVLDLDKTVALDAQGVTTRGKVRWLRHRLEPEACRFTTELRLAVSAVAGVGAGHWEDDTVAPEGTAAGTAALTEDATIEFHYGPAEDHEILITFPAVAAADRDQADTTIITTIAAAIAEDPLTVVF